MADPDSDRHDGPDREPVDPQDAMSPPQPPAAPPAWAPPARSGGLGSVATRVVTGIVGSLLLVSILLNVYLGVFVFSSMRGPSESVWRAGDASQRVVILPIDGLIEESAAGFVRRAIKALEKNPPAAVVLRVESGGGLVTASDQIWRRLATFGEQAGIPVVASFGSVAASGGYYVAAPADRIFAEPTTVTGSIGVIAQAFTVDQLLEKIGVTPEIITSTASTRKDALNPMRSWTDGDRAKLREILDSAHDRFVEVVSQGRAGILTEAQVRSLATGEIFTAGQAKDNGLVDAIGYIEDAIDEAASLGGVPQGVAPQVTLIREPAGFGLAGLLGARSARSERFSWTAREARHWIAEMAVPRLEYRWSPGNDR